MRKVIASINMTLDGYCDHTAVEPDDELHESFNDLLRGGDTILFGRKTYQLMESAWPSIVKEPTGNKPVDEFAILIDNIDKVVFSDTLQKVEWKNTRLAKDGIKEEVLKLKSVGEGKDILAGSPSIINALTNLGLVDEYRLCVHPVVVGKGLPLFNNINERVELKLIKSKTIGSGVQMLCYEPNNN